MFYCHYFYINLQIGKTNEQLFHLLAICLTLQPQRIEGYFQKIF